MFKILLVVPMKQNLACCLEVTHFLDFSVLVRRESFFLFHLHTLPARSQHQSLLSLARLIIQLTGSVLHHRLELLWRKRMLSLQSMMCLITVSALLDTLLHLVLY